MKVTYWSDYACPYCYIGETRLKRATEGIEELLYAAYFTDDSCAFYLESEDVAFVGDAVYDGGPGLSVFPAGDAARLRDSIREKLLVLPSETALLSGHYRPVTVAELGRVMSARP